MKSKKASKDMVLDEDLNPLHGLTEEGKIECQRIHKEAAYRKHANPILCLFKKLLVRLQVLFK